MTSTVDLPVPERALAVSAHPDDSEFGCGATLAKWSDRGCEASLVICTDGSKGSWDPEAEIGDLIAARVGEQQRAADQLGLTGEVIHLEYVDGELDNTAEARSRLAEVIRRLRPTVLLGHDPWKHYRLHPDHRQAGLLTCEAVVAARDPHFFPEHFLPENGLAPHRPETLLLFEAETPDHVEDVRGWAGAKLAALLAHESQFESTMGIGGGDDGSDLQRFEEQVLDELVAAGAVAGLDLGEAFKRIDDL